MKSQFDEGPQVAIKFEEAMKILFQTPKLEVDRKPEAATSRKKKQTDKD